MEEKILECEDCHFRTNIPIDFDYDEAYCESCKGRIKEVEKIYCPERQRAEEPLLQIELEDEHSLPKVFYKGKEITGKIKIDFDWRTKGLIDLGGLEFNLEYGDDKGIVHKVGRRRGDFR